MMTKAPVWIVAAVSTAYMLVGTNQSNLVMQWQNVHKRWCHYKQDPKKTAVIGEMGPDTRRLRWRRLIHFNGVAFIDFDIDFCITGSTERAQSHHFPLCLCNTRDVLGPVRRILQKCHLQTRQDAAAVLYDIATSRWESNFSCWFSGLFYTTERI